MTAFLTWRSWTKTALCDIFDTVADMDEAEEAAALAARCNAVSDVVEVSDCSSEEQESEGTSDLGADEWLA